MQCNFIFLRCEVILARRGVQLLHCGFIFLRCGIIFLRCNFILERCGVQFLRCSFTFLRCGRINKRESPPQRKMHILFFTKRFPHEKNKKSISLPSFCQRQKKNKFPTASPAYSQTHRIKSTAYNMVLPKDGVNRFFENSFSSIHKKLFLFHIFCNLEAEKVFCSRRLFFPLFVSSSPSFGNTFSVIGNFTKNTHK